MLLLSFILCSCQQHKQNNDVNTHSIASDPNDISEKEGVTSIHVDLSIAAPVKLSEVFSNIDYKVLTTPNGVFVGKADKVIGAEKMFFIKSNGKIFIFNNDGSFKMKIDQQGEGPHQYRAITDFIVDTLVHKISILDNHSFSVFEFDYEGKFLDNWKHGILAFQFYKIDDNKYIFYSDKESASSYNGRFLLYDKNKNRVIKNYIPLDRRRIKYESFLDVNNFFKRNHELLISCSGNDTIFSIKKEKIHPKYIFTFGNDRVPDKFYEKKLKSIIEFNNYRLKNEFAGLYYNAFGENDHMIISQIVKGRSVYYLWFNKDTKSYHLINRFDDDLDINGIRITAASTFPTFFEANRAIRVLEPEVIMNTLDSLKKASSKDEWSILLAKNHYIKLLADKVSMASNPVIQIMTYK